MERINESLERKITGGEAITLATVIAVMAIAVLTIVAWKLFAGEKGTVTIPGGFKLQWSAARSLIYSLLIK